MADDPDEAEYQHGVSLQRAGRFEEAVAVYLPLAERALTVKLATNLGLALGETAEYPQAPHYLKLAAEHRRTDGGLWRALGRAYGESGDLDLAEQAYRNALALDPRDLHAELGLGGVYLSGGRYAEGWPLMSARAELHPDVVPAVVVPYPEWRGEPIDGKSILVWVEQGFGDKIQFARFAKALKSRGASRVSLACSPNLTDLFSTLTGVDELIPIGVGASTSVASHDYWSRYLSLPEHLGITLETLPSEPYLAAPPQRRARWAGFGRGARVGVAWKASPTGFNGVNKGLPDPLAERLLAVGAISLHPEDTGAKDFADTAAIIDGLDLLVSIDTSVAHLAGAMGKPCWTLLPALHCDWRWLRDRTSSPWYPTMRLYRQTRAKDWTETIDRVIDDLAAAGLAGRGLGAP
ncbi:tetratricopeptide repeat protein [Phenylobacterium sp.]|uniref:tetratricopeptide repeat-containing glycosyltransferase family protein n=1 Tax=Phenylobacterium sp. TaxID=1871053 RepID=UPI0011FBE565|nr:tetratricopeptide repeat protein [Phenylobacterium sp.]THD70135.1 MAG: tetratricopeptide repeat protein [Phenylobacterium sp.]